VKRAIALTTALGVAALLPSTASTAGAAPGGLSACDHRRDFRGIPCTEVDRAIREAAAEFRVDETRLRRIVRCESKFDPYADSGRYKGLFQQDSRSWAGRVAEFNANVSPDVPGNYHNPFDNARVSARMMGLDGGSHWPNC
jgi:hypothetical protein